MSTDQYADDGEEYSVNDDNMAPGEPTGDNFNGLPVLADVNHPRVPSMQHEYAKREVRNTGRTDVEYLSYALSSMDRPVLIEGQSGVGKDTLVTHVAEQTNRPVVRVNFGLDTTFETLIGMHHPTEDGHFGWRDGLLTKAVRNGWIFVADEINAAPPEATMPLHGITERNGDRYLTIQKTGEILTDGAENAESRIHPEFKLVATMNPPHYPGVDEMNMAFKNRFTAMPMSWLDQDAEVEILLEETGIGKRAAESLVTMANDLRGQLDGNTVRTPVSTRDMIKVANMVSDGFMDMKSAAKVVIAGGAKSGDENAFSSAIDRRID